MPGHQTTGGNVMTQSSSYYTELVPFTFMILCFCIFYFVSPAVYKSAHLPIYSAPETYCFSGSGLVYVVGKSLIIYFLGISWAIFMYLFDANFGILTRIALCIFLTWKYLN